MRATKGVSLLEVLRERGPELALVASYNVHFPFFEQVVLRRLRSGGCGYVVVLMDAGQLAAAVRDPEARPRLAGRGYGILPIRAPGVFHPKFMLLVGKERSRLVVGSHNVTLAGFGLNKEITTVFEPGQDGGSRGPLQATWRFARDWVSGVSARNLELLTPFEKVAPWLTDEPEEPGEEGPWVLGSSRSGAALWGALRALIEKDVTSVTVLGPSFDEHLDCLRTIEKDLQPRDLIVAIDPGSASITPQAEKRLPKARFVDVSMSRWKGDYNRVHAKAYRFCFRRGGEILVSGSANPSRQAWIAPPDERNAELVVVQRLGPSDKLVSELRLDHLVDLPAVSGEGWQAIAERRGSESETDAGRAGSVEIAVACNEGFLVPERFTAGVPRDAVALVSPSDEVTRPEALEPRGREVLVRVRDRRVLETTVQLKVSRAKETMVALVQRVDDLLEDAFDDTRRALKSALSGLEGDPGQLEQLFKIVERVLFEPPTIAPREATPRGQREAPAKTGEGDGLSVSLADTPLAKRLGRARIGGDLGALLDAFIFKLGPLVAWAGDAAPRLRAEDDLAPAEDEEEPRDPDRGALLAEMCRGKSHRLTRRLLKRLEEAAEASEGAIHAVVKLAAGLGLIHYLRTNEGRFSWRTTNDDLVAIEDRIELFVGGSQTLLAPKKGLAVHAITQIGARGFDELSSARALLCWLAFDCGCDLGSPYEGEDEDDDADDAFGTDLTFRGFLLHSLGEVVADEAARAALEQECDGMGEGARAWCDRHLRLAEALRKIRRTRNPRAARPQEINPGDVVYPALVPTAPAYVVLWSSSEKAGVVDLETGTEKQFLIRYLAKAQIPGWRAV